MDAIDHLDGILADTEAIAAAETAVAALREHRNGLFRAAHKGGCSASAIAAVSGVNKSWVHQIVAAPKEQS